MNRDYLIAELEKGCSVFHEDELNTQWVLYWDNAFVLQLVDPANNTLLDEHRYNDLDECLSVANKIAPFAEWASMNDC